MHLDVILGPDIISPLSENVRLSPFGRILLRPHGVKKYVNWIKDQMRADICGCETLSGAEAEAVEGEPAQTRQ